MPLLATTVSIPSSRTVAQLVTESPRRADLRGFLSSVGSMDVLGVAGKVRQPPQPPITECGPSTSGLLVRRYREHVTDIIPRFFHAQATRNCGESIFLWENRIYYRVDGLMIYLALCRLQRLPLSESLGPMRHSEPISLLEPYDSSTRPGGFGVRSMASAPRQQGFLGKTQRSKTVPTGLPRSETNRNYSFDASHCHNSWVQPRARWRAGTPPESADSKIPAQESRVNTAWALQRSIGEAFLRHARLTTHNSRSPFSSSVLPLK